MEDLMEMKSYTKLIAKQSKQLESLRRKHEKVSVIVCVVLCSCFYPSTYPMNGAGSIMFWGCLTIYAGQLSLASLRGRLIEYQLRLG